MKTLVIYTFHEYSEPVKYFIKHGLFESQDVTFHLVINSPVITVRLAHYRNVVVYNRDNIGHDFGAWSYSLFKDDNYTKYDYFILINSSVKGPFIPLYVKDSWITLLTQNITEDVKLFGTTIGCYDGLPHVQSMLLVTDRIGIKVGIDTGIFIPNPIVMERWDVIVQKELGYSTQILKSGYNIGCLLACYSGLDFRNNMTVKKTFPTNINVFGHDTYSGIEVHPYEVIFIKIPKCEGHEYLLKVIERFTIWFNKNKEMNFNWKDYLKLNRDVYMINNSEEFAIDHYNKFGRYENRQIQLNELKNWEVYGALNCDILPTHRDKRSIQEHYYLHGFKEGRQIAIPGFNVDRFNWIYYKFHNDIPEIVTKIQAIYHFNALGKHLDYYPSTGITKTPANKKFYLIDLNPLSTSGLFNQIISLINGIILAWCCNRDLYVTGFYPDYNQKRMCKLDEIINMVHLNNLLKIEGINVTVSENYKGKPWKKSVLFDPTKIDFNDARYVGLRGKKDTEPIDQKKLILIMKHLFIETDEYIDIGDVFDYFIFRENIDETFKLWYRNIIINLKYSDKINSVVDYCLNKFNIKEGQYSSMHLRLEDDIIFHRPDKTMPEAEYANHIKERYEKDFDKFFSKDEIIYISTYLMKAPNKYNYYVLNVKTRFKNIKYWKKPELYWRNDIKDVTDGREFDALIDYLICVKSSKFMGFAGSTFSETLKYYFAESNKPTLLI